MYFSYLLKPIFAFLIFFGLFGKISAQDKNYPREIKWGKTSITLDKKPERIFVGYVSALEILEKLVGEKRIVGCPKFSIDPKYSNCVEFAKKISYLYDTPDMEIIEKCNPDIVILASFNDPKFLEVLKNFKRKYIVLDKFDSYGDICETIKFLGELTGEEQKAANLVKGMDADLKLISDSAPAKKIRVMSFGYNSYTAGAGTIFGEMISMAGCENVAATFGLKGHQQVDYEQLIKMNPDWFVIYSIELDAKEKFITEMKKNPAFGFVTALKNSQVIVLSPAYGTAASQYFVDGVKELSQKIKNLK
jgi:iron complex transport system substrate-binding protein